LDSTPRQILIYRAMGWGNRIPNYTHLPLVIGSDGRRLAKRHGDTRLSFYRDQGVSSQRLHALLARWCGMDCGDCATLDQILENFRLDAVPTKPIVFSSADDQWLRGA
jgi:glutamyl-tRNA synthetase